MSIDVKYRANANAIAVGGRDGRASTPDGTLDLKLATPREVGGAGDDGTNPEQLFAAGYAACFLSALHLVARREKVELRPETVIRSAVGIGPNGAGGFGLAVELVADMPGDAERACANRPVLEKPRPLTSKQSEITDDHQKL